MDIDKSKVAEIWLKNFPDDWNGIYLALSIAYPQASESWKLYYSNILNTDDEFQNIKLQFHYGDKKAGLLPSDDEFKLYLWDRANKEYKGSDRMKAAFLYAQVAGFIKKDSNSPNGNTVNVMVIPAESASVDAWEEKARISQNKLRGTQVIDHEPT